MIWKPLSVSLRQGLIYRLVLCLSFAGSVDERLFAQADPPGDAKSGKIEPPLAWNRPDQYEPPNYKQFFPDDADAGLQLTACLEGKAKWPADVDERLALIRRGLRRASRHRTTLMGSIGNQFVWNIKDQDARAIELLYHATNSDDAEIAHYAFYHGPAVVSQRTLNLVRALMEQYPSLGEQNQGRIAWGMKTYGDKEQTRRLLLELLDHHEQLSDPTVCSALDTYRAVFETSPPQMERFDAVGKWVIAIHRTDVSASHPHAPRILRDTIEYLLRGRKERLIDLVTRVDNGHETAVVLVQGVQARADLAAGAASHIYCRVDFNEMLSPRILQERRLREFARHLPSGLPERARPVYTRPPAGETHAYALNEFVAPDFAKFFPDDMEAAKKLDEVYSSRESIELTDRELLTLFRQGIRRSSHTPNAMFGWISGALGWPRDPLLTEILYQAVDPNAPLAVRDAGIYYGFGLGDSKTKNILEAMFRVYMAPPFDRTTNQNLRSRILWGLGVHEDDKYYLATRFEEVLRDHAMLSDDALMLADQAYRQLTENEPPNVADYSTRGVYLIIFRPMAEESINLTKQKLATRLGKSDLLLHTVVFDVRGQVSAMVAVRGLAGKKWLIDNLQAEPTLPIDGAERLTRELFKQVEGKSPISEFEKYVTPQQ